MDENARERVIQYAHKTPRSAEGHPTRADEAFYNKRVNRPATIQEHYMIIKPSERGASEEKLAKALNIDVKRIKTKQRSLSTSA